eukprot:10766-Amphidinium_carterae.1
MLRTLVCKLDVLHPSKLYQARSEETHCPAPPVLTSRSRCQYAKNHRDWPQQCLNRGELPTQPSLTRLKLERGCRKHDCQTAKSVSSEDYRADPREAGGGLRTGL